jgi:chromate transporter
LSAIYLTVGRVALVQGLLFGLKAAVLAVVLEALIKVSRRALNRARWSRLAVVAFVAIAFLKLPFPADRRRGGGNRRGAAPRRAATERRRGG